MRILVELAGQRSVTGKFYVGLIYRDERATGQCLQQLRDGRRLHGIAGGIVGAAQEHDARVGIAGREHRIGVEGEPLRDFQWDFTHGRTLDARGDGIHSERGRADDHVVDAGAAETAQQQVDGFIAAATRQQLIGTHAIQRRQALRQHMRVRLGVTVEAGDGAIGFRAPG